MKKRGLRIFVGILAAALMVILSCMLAACNGSGGSDTDKNNPSDNNTPELAPKAESIAASEYFDRLWTLTSALGSREIGEESDLALKADIAVELGTKGLLTDRTQQSLELGVDYEMVLDRSSKDEDGVHNSENTALKLKIYSGDIEVCALYFFVKFPSQIFIDFDGMQIVMSAELAGLNDSFGTQIGNMLYGKGEDGSSANELLNTFLSVMGPDKNWNLNTPINQLLELAGVPLKSMLTESEDMANLISLLLGMKPEELFDGEDIDILRILKADAVSGMFTATKTAGKDSDEYVVKLGSAGGSAGAPDVSGILGAMGGNFGDMSGAIDNIMGGMIGVMQFASHANANVGFVDRDGSLDDLYLYVDFKGFEEMMLDVDGSTPVYPFVKCTLRDIELGEASDYSLGVNTEDYSSEVAFEVREQLSVGGFGMDVEADGAAEQSGDTAELYAVGTLDLMGLGSENKTRLNAYLAISGTHMLDVSFDSTTLAIVPNLAFNADGEMKALVASVGARAYDLIKTYIFGGEDAPALNKFADSFFAKDEEDNIDFSRLADGFKGVIIRGFDIGATFANAVQKAIERMSGLAPDNNGEGETDGQTPEKEGEGQPPQQGEQDSGNVWDQLPDMSQYMPTYKQIVSALKAVISTVSLQNGDVRFETQDVFGLLLGASGEDITRDQLKAEVLAEAKQLLESYAEDYGDYYAMIGEAVAALRIDGVQPYVAAHTEDAVKDALSAVSYLVDIIVDTPISVLAEVNFSDGIAVTFRVGMAGAFAQYELSLNAYAIADDTFADLADGHDEQDGYVVIDIADFAPAEQE